MFWMSAQVQEQLHTRKKTQRINAPALPYWKVGTTYLSKITTFEDIILTYKISLQIQMRVTSR